jgi:threonylcarbamoyladenosine tRNA methylthiotransferase MtaB
MGCWPKAYGDDTKRFNVDFILKAGETSASVKMISESFGVEYDSEDAEKNIVGKKRKSRYFLKIQDGCEQFCTYCIVPYARGPLTSVSKEDALKEAESAVKTGYQEIVLCGIHLGLYGLNNIKDGPINKNLTDLILEMLTMEGLGRIRLSSIEINEVTEDLIRLIKQNEKMCKHLHIPLQSGNEKILKLMNRPYGLEVFERKISEIRKAVPDISINTDVIVGFPGETEKDFEEICKFVKKIKFSKLHVFPFSAHEKTPAFNFPDKVSENDKKKRAEILRKIGDEMEKEYIDGFKNKEFNVLVERLVGDKFIGKNEYYFDVEIGKDKLQDSKDGKIIGKIIKISK